MKMRDMSRNLPLGADWSLEKTLIFSAAVLAAVYSVVLFIGRYDQFVDSVIYSTYYEVKTLRPGAMATDFYVLLPGIFLGWKVIALCMAALAAYHYLLHYQGGSRSIYTMLRLPSRLELHRRCLTVPVLTALSCFVCVMILTALFYLGYIIFTPEQCITPGQLKLLRMSILGF